MEKKKMTDLSNLEDLDFNEVIDSKGTSYAVFRKSLRPDFRITWLQIGAAFLALILLFLIPLLIPDFPPPLLWIGLIPIAILAGFLIAFIQLFVHEASHYYLHPNRVLNDRLANIFLCSWVGIDMKVYRKIHWKHHQGLATPLDTENSYFNALTPGFLLETFTGIHLLRILRGRNQADLLNADQKKRATRMLFVGFLLNLTLLLLLAFQELWPLAIAWVMAMLIFFPFFASIRQLLEHRHEEAGSDLKFYQVTRPKISRLFTESWLSGLLGAAGFNRHLIHHWDPDLPFTALKKAEEFLASCEKTGQRIEQARTGYWKTFRKLLTSF